MLRAKLRNAKTYEEWKEAAIEMDEFLGFDVWKTVSLSFELFPLLLLVFLHSSVTL